MKNAGFVLAMMSASAMNLLRVLLAVALLPQDQFGLYTAGLGAVGLIGLLIGFGLLDSTTKYYPRLWVAGRPDLMRRDALLVSGHMALRAGGVTLVLIALVQTGWVGMGTGAALVIGAMVYGSVLLSLVAAMIRAIGSMRLLVTFSIIRGLVPLALVAAVLPQGDWLLALIAELVATGLVLVGGLVATASRFKLAPAADPGLLPERDLSGGRRLYLANLMSSGISLGDRAVITALLGPQVGGAYGVPAVVVQSGNLLAGILSQKYGPDMIRALHRNPDPRAMLRLLRFPMAILALATLAAALVMLLGPIVSQALQAFFESRGFGVMTALLSAGLILLQVFLLLQFAVVARDDEGAVIRSSLIALVICAAGFAVTVVSGAGVDGFLAAVLLARLGQTASLVRALTR